MSELRTRTVSTKVTAQEHDMLVALAADRALGEWVRDVVLRAAMTDPTAAAQCTILEEVLALRRVVVNLGFALATGERITADQMRGLIDEADAEKGETARARLSVE
jgi:hypothetical protein